MDISVDLVAELVQLIFRMVLPLFAHMRKGQHSGKPIHPANLPTSVRKCRGKRRRKSRGGGKPFMKASRNQGLSGLECPRMDHWLSPPPPYFGPSWVLKSDLVCS